MCKKSSRALSGFSALSCKMPVRRLRRVLKYSSVGVLSEIVEKYALNRCRRALSHNVKHIVDFLHNIIEQTDRTRLSDGIGKGTVEVSIVFYFHKVVECVQKILARFKRLFRAFAQNARSAPPSGIKILLGRRFARNRRKIRVKSLPTRSFAQRKTYR